MATATLSLKIFPQDENIKFVGWQTKFKNLIEKVFLSEDLPGVLPDFKGFTKTYNRSNWFQPLYEGALSRKPLVVRIDEDDVWALKDTGWQHKVRLAWHSICKAQTSTVSETKLEAPVTVAISTNALPLTVKDTEAYKALMATGYMTYTRLPCSGISDSEGTALERKLDKDRFGKDGMFVPKSILVLSDVEKVKCIFSKLFTGIQRYSMSKLKDLESIEYIYEQEPLAVELLANARLLWQAGLEMGIDMMSLFSKLDEDSKHSTLIIDENQKGDWEMRYKPSCSDISYALSYLRQKF